MIRTEGRETESQEAASETVESKEERRRLRRKKGMILPLACGRQSMLPLLLKELLLLTLPDAALRVLPVLLLGLFCRRLQELFSLRLLLVPTVLLLGSALPLLQSLRRERTLLTRQKSSPSWTAVFLLPFLLLLLFEPLLLLPCVLLTPCWLSEMSLLLPFHTLLLLLWHTLWLFLRPTEDVLLWLPIHRKLALVLLQTLLLLYKVLPLLLLLRPSRLVEPLPSVLLLQDSKDALLVAEGAVRGEGKKQL